MAEDLHKQIDRERKAANPAASDLAVFRRYVEGDQDATLTADQKALLGAAAKHTYSDNMADTVISAWASRLTLTGFAVEDSAVEAFLNDDLYVRNGLGDLSYDTNYATARDGNHALMLRWLPDDRPADLDRIGEDGEVPTDRRAGRVTIHAEDWWDGKSGIWVAYDDRGRPAYAVKDFTQVMVDDTGNARERQRRTVYFPGMIHRYIKDGGWQPFVLPTDPPGTDGIVPWTKRDGSDLGIPVVHFSFPRFGKRRYGVSELAGGFLANQDHLNDVQQDLTAAARLIGFQVMTATGASFKETPKIQPGTFLHTSSEAARFGSIPPGDLTQLIETHGLKLQTVARTTATPAHIITGGDWPAGIALVQAEKPLIAKVRRLSRVIGPAWGTVAHRATEMVNAFGGMSLDEDAPITTRFDDPEQLDTLAQAEVLAAQVRAQTEMEALSDEASLIALGLTEAEARERIERKAGRREAAMTSFQSAFDRGDIGGE
jgi:hypothetical protein